MKNNNSLNLKAILFDLDGTLIDVELNKFVPAYLQLIAESVAHLIHPSTFIKKLMKASNEINNNDGTKTNDQVFEEVVFPIEGYTRVQLQPFLDQFYETKFVELRQFTQKKPEAREVVQCVFDNDYDVVIATTPLLPLTAIQQRLNWAGVGDFSYKLITHIENSKASKPNLIYYQQIIDYLGFPPEKCLMVGDEDKDVIAAKLGCQTFLVNSSNTILSEDMLTPSYSGSLRELKELVCN